MKEDLLARVAWNDLTVSQNGEDLDYLFIEWHCPSTESFQPVTISNMGNLFLKDDDGCTF